MNSVLRTNRRSSTKNESMGDGQKPYTLTVGVEIIDSEFEEPRAADTSW